MAAEPPTENLEQLSDDVASLNRVRNRLAAASDGQLSKILTALLPKLFHRLEGYHQIPTVESPQGQKLRLEAKGIIWGILDHALERLKGNPSLDVQDIMNALIPFLSSSNLVIGTWALAFQQLFIQRITPNNESSTTTTTSLPPAMMGELILCIDRLRREQMQDPKDNDKRRMINASWLLLDTIMIASGLKPMVDWERDTFDGKDVRWKAQKSNSWGSLASDEAVAAADADGSGVFHLLLDLLLFWPTETPESCGISLTSDECLRDKSIVPPEELSTVGIRRGRPAVRHKWTDMAHMYLRHLKLCALRLAAWPTHRGLFQEQNADRAMVLSVVLVSSNSMHGRLAADYVNGFDTANSLHKNSERFTTSSVSCSLSVACSLLILVAGDQHALPVLETYKEKHNSDLWEQILGPIPTFESMQRPRMPMGIAVRAIEFLLRHPIQLVGTEIEKKASARLLIDLTLLMSQSADGDARKEEEIKQGKYWSVLLIHHFYSQLTSASLVDRNDEWARQVLEKCLDASEAVLSVVVELGESQMRRERARHGQMPLGVPLPFNNRNDLNMLLNTHRETQKRKNLQMDDALKARQIAYKLITSLKQNILQRESKLFEMPIFLFKCVVHEDAFLQQNVADALEALLQEYTEKLKFVRSDTSGGDSPAEETDLRDRALPLLGCLLDAALSDSELARSAAAQWISKLLRFMDAEAAHHLATYLAQDVDPKVAAVAKSVLTLNINAEKGAAMDVTFYNFLDLDDAFEKEPIQRELRIRTETVSRELAISTESAAIILYDFKFSVDDLRIAFNEDPHGILESSGLTSSSSISADANRAQDIFCSICYDELGEMGGKSLGCGHEFCQACWGSFLETAASEGTMHFLNARCPQHKCSARVRLDHLQHLAPSLCSKWNTAFIDAFVELDPSYRFCPGPDCKLVATVPLADQRCQPLECERCSTQFCFECGEKPHQPATCEDNAEFHKIMGTSSMWIKKYSKPCPGCNAPIEKTEGCNHMTCGKCKQEFCWLCLTKLNFHSEGHACNQYDPAENAEDDYEKHALFVSDRYQAHDDSEEFARGHLKRFLEKPQKLVEMFWFLTDDDERILHSALETVIRARGVLKNSYLASFGLRKDPQKMKTLESHQGALEMFTERLSQLTEKNLHSVLAEKGQTKLIQHFQGLAFYTVSVSRYMQRFLDVCADLHGRSQAANVLT